MMRKNKTPLQIIQQEKKILKKSFLTEEKKIVENISYLQKHWGSLAMNSAVNHVKEFIGFPSAETENKGSDQYEKIQQITGVASNIFPIIWGIAQPLLLKYAFRKFKELFSRKKKKKDNS